MNVVLHDKKLLQQSSPLDVIVGSARTCYSSKDIVTPEETKDWDNKQRLALELFDSGHLTTFQHTSYTFKITGISKYIVMRLLHNHKNYNSDEKSLRYTSLTDVNDFVIPDFLDEDDKTKTEKLIKKSFNRYQDILSEDMGVDFYAPKSKKTDKKYIRKKNGEFFRYILPVGLKTNLYHTINITTLFRYMVVANNLSEGQKEAKELVGKMCDELISVEPFFKTFFDKLQTHTMNVSDFNFDDFYKPFLNWEDKNGVYVSDIVGDLSEIDEKNMQNTISPHVVWSGNSNKTHGSVSISTKMSMVTLAQNQRHRTGTYSFPNVRDQYRCYLTKDGDSDRFFDFYTPKIIDKSDFRVSYNIIIYELYDLYIELAEKYGEKHLGELVYLIPIAHKFETTEHIDLVSFYHKAQKRLCFTSQEEIYNYTYNIVSVMYDLGIDGIEKLAPPCISRMKNNISPICPEGGRSCGFPVWKTKSVVDLKRGII
jgi:thymidylate synthase (FAD)